MKCNRNGFNNCQRRWWKTVGEEEWPTLRDKALGALIQPDTSVPPVQDYHAIRIRGSLGTSRKTSNITLNLSKLGKLVARSGLEIATCVEVPLVIPLAIYLLLENMRDMLSIEFDGREVAVISAILINSLRGRPTDPKTITRTACECVKAKGNAEGLRKADVAAILGKLAKLRVAAMRGGEWRLRERVTISPT